MYSGPQSRILFPMVVTLCYDPLSKSLFSLGRCWWPYGRLWTNLFFIFNNSLFFFLSLVVSQLQMVMDRFWVPYYSTRPHTRGLKNPRTRAHICVSTNICTCTLWVSKYTFSCPFTRTSNKNLSIHYNLSCHFNFLTTLKKMEGCYCWVQK